MKEKVLLDIDGVIADFYLAFGQHLNKNLSANINLNYEPNEYSMHEWGHHLLEYQVNAEVPNWILNGGYFDMPIFSGAQEFIFKLMDKYDVYIVTARVGDFSIDFDTHIRQLIKEDTKRWFKKYGIPSNKLFFEHNKVDFCKRHNIKIIIEDKLQTVLKAADSGIRSILVDRGWNRDPKRDRHFNIFVTHSYDDILNILEFLSAETKKI